MKTTEASSLLQQSVASTAPAPVLLLPTNYLRHLLLLVASRGGQTDRLLALSGLTETELEQPDSLVNLPQFLLLLREARTALNEPALGLYLGSQLTITSHGLLGLAAMSSATLEEALQLSCKYIATRTPLVSLHLDTTGRYARLSIDELYALGDLRSLFLEALSVTILAVIDFVVQRQCQPIAMHFAFAAPPYQALYQAFFRCPVLFDQPRHQLILPKSALQLRSLLADKQMQLQASQQCANELQQWQQRQSVSGQIRLLLGRVKGRCPGFAQIAAELALSPRTLRRRLQDEGTSYQQLLEQWRQQMAEQYLTTTKLSMQQISDLLGYNDPANFNRAFRRQHAGLSPLRFRQGTNHNVDVKRFT